MNKATLFVLYAVATPLLLGLMGIGWLMQKRYAGLPLTTPTEGNCWSYAVPRWLRDPRHTYLVMRLSQSNAWPHLFLAHSIEKLYIEEFQPVARRWGWKSYLHALWFTGRVRKGFGEEE